jgi:hypothetical protein
MKWATGVIFGSWLQSLFGNDGGPLFWIAGIFAVVVILALLSFIAFAYCIYLPFVTVVEWIKPKN